MKVFGEEGKGGPEGECFECEDDFGARFVGQGAEDAGVVFEGFGGDEVSGHRAGLFVGFVFVEALERLFTLDPGEGEDFRDFDLAVFDDGVVEGESEEDAGFVFFGTGEYASGEGSTLGVTDDLVVEIRAFEVEGLPE